MLFFFFLDVMLLHINRLQYNIKVTYMHWEIKIHVTHFIEIFVLLCWLGSESEISLRYACNFLLLL